MEMRLRNESAAEKNKKATDKQTQRAAKNMEVRLRNGCVGEMIKLCGWKNGRATDNESAAKKDVRTGDKIMRQ